MTATRTLREDFLKGKVPLPSLPEVVRKVLKLTNDPDSGPDDFEKLLRNDPPFVASLLRMANSPLMGIGRSISTIGEAVVVVGFQRLSRIAVTIGASTFLERDFRCYGYERRGLWQHSVCVASCAQTFGRVLGMSTRRTDELFTAGLLTDLGKIVLAPFLVRAGVTVESGCDQVLELERKALGIDHQEAGKLVATAWSLGPAIISVIAHHHDEKLAEEYHEFVAIMRQADSFVHEHGIGLRKDVRLALKVVEPESSESGFEEWRRIRAELLGGMKAALETLDHL